jgi:hypothetical protein
VAEASQTFWVLPNEENFVSNKDVNAVRQVLMNELGLTRESVRAMASELVQASVDKHVRALIADGHIQKMVDSAVSKVLATNQWDSAALERIAAEAAGKAFQERVFQLMVKQ